MSENESPITQSSQGTYIAAVFILALLSLLFTLSTYQQLDGLAAVVANLEKRDMKGDQSSDAKLQAQIDELKGKIDAMAAAKAAPPAEAPPAEAAPEGAH